ncbi:MAG: hypothetical protein R3E60_01130 [Alphaproteobacteria bacterium]
MRQIIFFATVITAFIGASLCSIGASAQSSQNSTPAASTKIADPAPADLETLGRLLSDERIRLWLQKQIASQGQEMAAESETPPAKTFQETLQFYLAQLRGKFLWLNDSIAALPQQITHAREIWSLEMGEGETLRSLVYILVFLSIGILAEFAFWKGTSDLRNRALHMQQDRIRERLQLLGARTLYNAISIGIFAFGSSGGFLIFTWPTIVELFVVTYLTAFVIVRFVAILGRLTLAPRIASIRPIPLDDAAAVYTDRCMIALAVVGGFGFLTSGALKELGFAPDAQILLTYAVGFILAIMVTVMAWWGQPHLRRMAAQQLYGRSRFTIFMIEIWPVLAKFTPSFYGCFGLSVGTLWLGLLQLSWPCPS